MKIELSGSESELTKKVDFLHAKSCALQDDFIWKKWVLFFVWFAIDLTFYYKLIFIENNIILLVYNFFRLEKLQTWLKLVKIILCLKGPVFN